MGDHPGEIPDPRVGAADEYRHEEKLWTEHVGVVVTPERDARKNAQVLAGVADNEANDGEDENGAPPIAFGAMAEGEGDEPDSDAEDRDERRECERRTAGRRRHLPALLEAQEHGSRVTYHGGGSGEDADEVSAEPQPEGRRGEPLRDVEDGHTWEVEVRKSDGTIVDVRLDRNLKLVKIGAEEARDFDFDDD